MSESNDGILTIFRVGPVTCSVPGVQVERVIQAPERLTHIPWAPPEVPGVFPHHSEAAVAVCLRRKFGLPSRKGGSGEMVICRIDGQLKALWVDLVLDVTTAAGSLWTPMPRALSRAVFDGFLHHNDWLILTSTVERLYRMPCAAPLVSQVSADIKEREVEIPADALATEEAAQPQAKPSSDAEQTPETGQPTTEISEPEPRIVLPFGKPSLTPFDPTPRRWAPDHPRVAASYRSTSPVVETRRPRVFSMAPPPPPGIESVVARPHRDDARTTPGRYGGSKFFLGGAIAAMLLLGIAALLDSANAYTSRDTSAGGTSNRVLATLATTDGARSARSRGTPRARDTGPSQRESHSVADPATPPQRLPAAAAEPPEAVTRPHAPADANGARPGPEPEPAVTIVLELTAQPSDSRSPGEAARDEGVLVSGTTITHVVVKGDTLWDICERYLGDPFRYPEVAGWSSIVDPHWIYPGDLVRIVIR